MSWDADGISQPHPVHGGWAGGRAGLPLKAQPGVDRTAGGQPGVW